MDIPSFGNFTQISALNKTPKSRYINAIYLITYKIAKSYEIPTRHQTSKNNKYLQ